MDLDDISREIVRRFDDKTAARERALPAARTAIRCCANAIRALHRGEIGNAEELMDRARAAIDDGLGAVADHPDIRFAGYLQDAQKEYAEARVTAALISGNEVPPTPETLGVEDAPYLNGIAEAIGEGRRHVLNLLRSGDVDGGDRMLAAMDDLYALLASIDYPDAITGNLRRSTDVARSLIEKTRGDLAVARVASDLHDAIDRHSREIRRDE